MSEAKGSADEAIGRPQEWREGRYQEPDKPVDESVRKPAANREQLQEIASTPVTQKDYESIEKP